MISPNINELRLIIEQLAYVHYMKILDKQLKFEGDPRYRFSTYVSNVQPR